MSWNPCCSCPPGGGGGGGGSTPPFDLEQLAANSDVAVTSTTQNVTVVFTGLTASHTATLPAAPVSGQRVTAVDGDGSLSQFPFVIDGNGKLINGLATFTMAASSQFSSSGGGVGPYGSISFRYNGTSWDVVYAYDNFYPSQIPSLELWFRADMGIVLGAGTSVAQWNDQSGTGDPNKNAVQAVAGQQPTQNLSDPAYNNKATLSFASASSQLLACSALTHIVPSPYTVFIVGNDDNSGVLETYLGEQSNAIWYLQGTAAGKYRIDGGAILTSTSARTSNPTIFGLGIDINGSIGINQLTPQVLGSVGNEALTRPVIGAENNGGGAPLNGKIAEIVVYAGISAAVNSQLNRYFSNRYSIALGP